MADGVRKGEEFSGTREVEERHRIDEANLDRWMKEHIEDYQGPLKVLQFKGGQSNPTYKLESPSRSYVMRRRPFGKLLPSAHAVDREFRVIAALGKQNFPVARAYALCTDDAVIGSTFYVMSMEDGRSFWDPTLPSQTPGSRRKIFVSKIETLAHLHNYEPEKIGHRAASAMARDHGEPYWRKVLEAGGKAWLKIIGGSDDAEKDFYGNSLSRLSVPALFIHGARDPRTEPGELDAVRAELPDSPIRLIENAGHSPHSEPAAADECNLIAFQFLDGLGS